MVILDPRTQATSLTPVTDWYCPTKWSAAESNASTSATGTTAEQMVRSDRRVGGVEAPGCSSNSKKIRPTTEPMSTLQPGTVVPWKLALEPLISPTTCRMWPLVLTARSRQEAPKLEAPLMSHRGWSASSKPTIMQSLFGGFLTENPKGVEVSVKPA